MFAGYFTAWVQNGGEGFVQGLGCFRLRDDESSRTVGHVLAEVGLCCHPETQVMLLMLEEFELYIYTYYTHIYIYIHNYTKIVSILPE